MAAGPRKFGPVRALARFRPQLRSCGRRCVAVAWRPVRGSSGRFVRSLGSVRSSVRAEAVRGGRMAAVPRKFGPVRALVWSGSLGSVRSSVRAEAVRGGRMAAVPRKFGPVRALVWSGSLGSVRSSVRAEAVRGGRMPPCRESSGRFVRSCGPARFRPVGSGHAARAVRVRPSPHRRSTAAAVLLRPALPAASRPTAPRRFSRRPSRRPLRRPSRCGAAACRA